MWNAQHRVGDGIEIALRVDRCHSDDNVTRASVDVASDAVGDLGRRADHEHLDRRHEREGQLVPPQAPLFRRPASTLGVVVEEYRDVEGRGDVVGVSAGAGGG